MKRTMTSRALGKHRLQRRLKPMPGMVAHQDDGTHEWVPGQQWGGMRQM